MVTRSGHAASVAAAYLVRVIGLGLRLRLGLGLGYLTLILTPRVGRGGTPRYEGVARYQLVQLHPYVHVRGCESRGRCEGRVRHQHRRARAHTMRECPAHGGGGGGGGGAGPRERGVTSERGAIGPERQGGSGGGWRSGRGWRIRLMWRRDGRGRRGSGGTELQARTEGAAPRLAPSLVEDLERITPGVGRAKEVGVEEG